MYIAYPRPLHNDNSNTTITEGTGAWLEDREKEKVVH